jgi:hypothetical protein
MFWDVQQPKLATRRNVIIESDDEDDVAIPAKKQKVGARLGCNTLLYTVLDRAGMCYVLYPRLYTGLYTGRRTSRTSLWWVHTVCRVPSRNDEARPCKACVGFQTGSLRCMCLHVQYVQHVRHVLIVSLGLVSSCVGVCRAVRVCVCVCAHAHLHACPPIRPV